ncbi:hypothetical protein BsWGS_25802 [Bradybaena similaris]
MPSYDVTDPPSPNGSQKSPAETRSRSPLVRTTSVDKPDGSVTSDRPSLETQLSTISSRRRQFSRRKSSSLDFPHVDSLMSLPSEQLDTLDLKAVPWWTSHRLRLAILCFLGFVSLYAQRVNLSIAIVSMVSHTPVITSNGHFNASNVTDYLTSDVSSGGVQNISLVQPQVDDKCPALSVTAKKLEFDWSKELEGLILGAFFWGYLVFQIPGGRLSERFGAKRVIAIAMFPVAILNILSPIAARTSPYLFLVVRVFVGLGEGVVYPAAQALWANWAPPNERSRLIGFSYAGGQFGNAIIFPIGGFLCAYGFDGGWPSVFYFVGATGFIWCVLWMILAHDTPDDDKSIGDLEKKYIKYSLGTNKKSKVRKNIPWKSILTSPAVWAIVVAHMCGNYGAYMLLTKLPAYMKEVLKFDIKSNGVFSMLPYLTFWLVITISGLLADLLISKEILSIAWTRKLMATIGMVGPAVSLVGAGFMECDQQVEAVVMLTLSVGLCGFHFSGYFINHGDIAPQFAGTLFGLSNMMATVPGIFSPYVVSAMTKNGTRQQWQYTFYVAAAVYCAGAVWYILLGRGEVQQWAKSDEDEAGPEEEKVGFGLHEIQETKEDEEDNEAEKKKQLLPHVTVKPSNRNERSSQV